MTAATGASLRVLVVMPGITPEAGAETSLAAVVPYLLAHGVELHLALLTKVQTLAPQLSSLGVQVHDLSDHVGLGRRVRALRRLVREVQPDLIHATLHEAHVPAQLVALLTRRRILVTWANTPQRAGENPRVGTAKRFGVRVLDVALAWASRARFHAVTKGVAETGRRHSLVAARRVRVAERGRDPRKFAPRPARELDAVRQTLGLGPADRAVLSVGRQDRTKGHVRLLDAMDALVSEHLELVLLVAGREGSASGDIRAKLTAMTHPERVHFLGHRDDIAVLLQVATVAVCSSYREGAAGAMIEAMASGTPIVTVKLDGLLGVLVDGVNALVVEPEHLADGIRAVLDDADGAHRRADQARADFGTRFTVERSAQALLELYDWAAR